MVDLSGASLPRQAGHKPGKNLEIWNTQGILVTWKTQGIVGEFCATSGKNYDKIIGSNICIKQLLPGKQDCQRMSVQF